MKIFFPLLDPIQAFIYPSAPQTSTSGPFFLTYINWMSGRTIIVTAWFDNILQAARFVFTVSGHRRLINSDKRQLEPVKQKLQER